MDLRKLGYLIIVSFYCNLCLPLCTWRNTCRQLVFGLWTRNFEDFIHLHDDFISQ
ncbi:hypothetical protein MKX01_008572, partial [Papaver californicum]